MQDMKKQNREASGSSYTPPDHRHRSWETCDLDSIRWLHARLGEEGVVQKRSKRKGKGGTSEVVSKAQYPNIDLVHRIKHEPELNNNLETSII